MFAQRQGVLGLTRDGTRYYRGSQSMSLIISACRELSTILRSVYGPCSMNKLIVNNIEKLFVTSDAATIIEQLEIQHPAAKILSSTSLMQKQEYGDGTNYVVILAGELLHQAEQLRKQGLHISDIVKGYELASSETLKILEKTICYKVGDIRNSQELKQAIATSVASKSLGYENYLVPLVVDAVLKVLPSNPLNFNTDNIRVVKFLGGSVHKSYLVEGMVIPRDVTSVAKHKKNCKILVLGCGLELAATETKGTVLLNNADDLIKFSCGEEDEMENIIKALADSGVEVIIVGGNISDLAQHCCDKHNLVTLKCQSKFELRRLCRTLGAASLIRLAVPTPEEVGYAESVDVKEVSSQNVTVFSTKDSHVSTIVLRGGTDNTLDELERAIGNGVRCFKNLIHDNHFVPGGGAAEIEISFRLKEFAAKTPGLEQYAVTKFAEAFEEIPRILASNAGLSSNEVLTQLFAAHKQDSKAGVDIEGVSAQGIIPTYGNDCRNYILDHHKTKECAIKLAVDAVTTIVMVSSIFLAKPAGGPNPPKREGHWDED